MRFLGGVGKSWHASVCPSRDTGVLKGVSLHAMAVSEG